MSCACFKPVSLWFVCSLPYLLYHLCLTILLHKEKKDDDDNNNNKNNNNNNDNNNNKDINIKYIKIK